MILFYFIDTVKTHRNLKIFSTLYRIKELHPLKDVNIDLNAFLTFCKLSRASEMSSHVQLPTSEWRLLENNG